MWHGREDPAALMLVQGLAQESEKEAVNGKVKTPWQRPETTLDAPLAHESTPRGWSVHLGAGNGLVPAVAARLGFFPVAFDRSIVNATATAKTLTALCSSGTPDNGLCDERIEVSACDSLSRLDTRAAGVVFHRVMPGAVVPDQSCKMVTVRIPTDKVGVQMAVAEAYRVLEPGGVCLLAGGNHEGVKPAVRLLEAVFGNSTLVAQHSGFRLARAQRMDGLSIHHIFDLPWLNVELFHEMGMSYGQSDDAVRDIQLFSRPGVFSWEHPDEATSLLAGCMKIQPGERVLDLGCGSGALGTIAALESGEQAMLLDADADAVRCARHTARAAGIADGVEVMASDVALAVDDRRFDVVVTNPPFHVGKSTDLTLPEAFIEEAWSTLEPGGRIVLVANRTLPYEGLLKNRFGTIRVLHDGQRFKVLGGRRDK